MCDVNSVQRSFWSVGWCGFCHRKTIKRDFLYFLTSPKIGRTNPGCVIKTDVVCDRRSPTVKFSFNPDAAEQAKIQSVTLKADNLTTLELLQLCNKHISVFAPKDEITVTKLETKSARRK
ncbi:uncharacterized protein LOC113378861 isoform X2 [Ctenocephalides felis]|uniref:uncharacterized protein LOC113378861 isoform X2 n=1 Tax=Ctenocephalides felis TaxID=7515 RepID=UPI000E6E4720|nr:uncharacterized protein LOC113378861 isoform X2 [Ctenocephalides felis]